MLKHELRDHLSRTFSEQELRQWYDPLAMRLAEADGQTPGQLVVEFPHPFFAAWFGEHFRERFEEQLAGLLGPGFTIGYRQGGGNGAGQAKSAPVVRRAVSHFPFGAQFTFDGFLVNKKNSFPLEAAKRIAAQAEVEYNPLVVCGESGSGKTHLLRALANAASRRDRPAHIWLGSPEDLAAVYARHHGDGHAARSFLLACDMLLVDDLQLLRQAPHLRAELLSLFNAFHDRKRQMVFACTERIGRADFLDDTLRSRLEWGLKLNLNRPDLDIRVRLVQSVCAQRKLALAPEQMLTLAQRFEDFRNLQGVLLKFTAFRELMRGDIDHKSFQQILSHTEEVARPTLTPETIMAVVAGRYGLNPRELKGQQRHKQVAQARQVAMYLCRELLGSSFPALGRAFGGKDHSTVLHAVKKIKQLQRDDQEMKRLLMELEEKCLAPDEETA